MRRTVLMLLFAILAGTTLAACIVHTPSRRYHQGARCQSACVEFAYRQNCYTRCSIWRNGICISRSPYCTRRRVCVRYATRCR